MNAYDFDGTLYQGDSAVDFWQFCLRKRPGLLRFLPRQLLGAARFALGLCQKEEFKSAFYSFLQGVPNAESLAGEFWGSAKQKFAPWYMERRRLDDVIVSASPEFLLEPARKALGAAFLIASKVDAKTGRCVSSNCEGREKVRRFFEAFGADAVVDEFYTDSRKDAPMSALAKRAFLVRKNRMKEFEGK